MHNYHIVSIHHLSENQKSRLRNGHPVRVRLGKHHKIHSSSEQVKKLEKAHADGKAYTMRMGPFQVTQHGTGLWGDIASKVKGFVKKHNLQDMVYPFIKGTKKRLHTGLSNLNKLGHETIDKLEPTELKRKEEGNLKSIWNGYRG